MIDTQMMVHKCQDRALLLLQIAQDCPTFAEQASFLAREWLTVAGIAGRLFSQDRASRKETHAN
jgi:hypothetical protein